MTVIIFFLSGEDSLYQGDKMKTFFSKRGLGLIGTTLAKLLYSPGGGGGSTPLYEPYGYVPPQRVWFLGLFGLKTGIHFNSESGLVFEGTTGVSIPNE